MRRLPVRTALLLALLITAACGSGGPSLSAAQRSGFCSAVRDLPGYPLQDPDEVLPRNSGMPGEQPEREAAAVELLPKWQQTRSVLEQIDGLAIEAISEDVQVAIGVVDSMITGLESVISYPLNDTPANTFTGDRREAFESLSELTSDECDILDQEAWGAESIE